MSVTLEFDKFPLVVLILAQEQLNDIEIVKTEMENVFNLAKENKMKVSVMIKGGTSEGFGLLASVQLIKYLMDVRKKIKKYFNRCCITMDEDKGMFSYILNIYTPARPLKLFNSAETDKAIEWVTTVE
jgi:hypothetical protein